MLCPMYTHCTDFFLFSQVFLQLTGEHVTQWITVHSSLSVVPLVSGQFPTQKSLPVRHERAGAGGDAPFACLPRHRVNKMEQNLHYAVQIAHITAQHTVLQGTGPSPADKFFRGCD